MVVETRSLTAKGNEEEEEEEEEEEVFHCCRRFRMIFLISACVEVTILRHLDFI